MQASYNEVNISMDLGRNPIFTKTLKVLLKTIYRLWSFFKVLNDPCRDFIFVNLGLGWMEI